MIVPLLWCCFCFYHAWLEESLLLLLSVAASFVFTIISLIFIMAALKRDTIHEQKSAGNLLLYPTSRKVDGMNYDIWSYSFTMLVTGNIINEKDNGLVMSWLMNSVD